MDSAAVQRLGRKNAPCKVDKDKSKLTTPHNPDGYLTYQIINIYKA